MTCKTTILEVNMNICSMDIIRGADTVDHNTPNGNRQMSRNTYRKFVAQLEAARQHDTAFPLWVQENIKCKVTAWDETNNGRSRRLYSVTILPNPSQLDYLEYLNQFVR